MTEELRVKTEMDGVNPVKFEYDSRNHCIESIEDKEGDGGYFILYVKSFSGVINITKKKGKEHLNIPILYQIF